MSRKLTFLGTGTSIGVPVIGCGCGVCVSDDPRNKRLRSSILLESPEGSLVVDTGPDFRQQCLRERITTLDAVLFTHAHTDHIMGFDDLRRFTVGHGRRLDIHATVPTLDRLKAAFSYAFDGENEYYGYLKPNPQPIHGPFRACGWFITPLPVSHGKIETTGFHFLSADGTRRFAYIPDAKILHEETWKMIQDIPLLILDGLQMEEHHTHLTIPESVEIAREVRARQTWLTHFSCRVDYRAIGPILPPNVSLAWDGLILNLEDGME